jgi:hypothetical protein
VRLFKNLFKAYQSIQQITARHRKYQWSRCRPVGFQTGSGAESNKAEQRNIEKARLEEENGGVRVVPLENEGL